MWGPKALPYMPERVIRVSQRRDCCQVCMVARCGKIARMLFRPSSNVRQTTAPLPEVEAQSEKQPKAIGTTISASILLAPEQEWGRYPLI